MKIFATLMPSIILYLSVLDISLSLKRSLEKDSSKLRIMFYVRMYVYTISVTHSQLLINECLTKVYVFITCFNYINP